jgi:hypothetical protein
MVHTNTLSLALYAAVVLLGLIVNVTMAAVTITQNADADTLSKTLLNPAAAGNGVMAISGATVAGDIRQFGTFDQTSGDLPGLGSTGVVLSTGIAVETITGPLNSRLGQPGDQDLETLLGQSGTTLDAAILSFDVTVTRQVSITVAYVLVSNEYGRNPSPFPDVLGAFRDRTNVAWIGDKPVTVVTLDCANKSGRTCNNGQVQPFQLAGYSSAKEFTFNLSPGIQRLKLAIADGNSDDSFITTVLLSFKSADLGLLGHRP